MASCPDCEAVMDVEEDEVEQGEVINCPDCGAELEVVNTNPIEVKRIEEEEEEDDEEEED
jgi:alpha-aminoadipate carrier protein LysW